MDENKLLKHVQNFIGAPGMIQLIPNPSLAIVGGIIDDLDSINVGDYRILIHPNIPEIRHGSVNRNAELDLIVINKFGVFGIDFQDRRGTVTAYESFWIQEFNGEERQLANPTRMVESKCRHLYNYLSTLYHPINVIPLIVLTQGKKNYINRSSMEFDYVIGIEDLTKILSKSQLNRQSNYKNLSDDEIVRIADSILKPMPSQRLAGDSTVDAPPPEKKKKRKGK